MITQRRLKTLLRYCPEEGVFTWKRKTNQFTEIGSIAGCSSSKGYIKITVDNREYRAHRLAFLYMEGSFPKDQVDHINRIREDNRWKNLRHATALINAGNTTVNNPFVGVSFDSRRNKWVSELRVKGKRYRKRFTTYYAACYNRHYLERLHA